MQQFRVSVTDFTITGLNLLKCKNNSLPALHSCLCFRFRAIPPVISLLCFNHFISISCHSSGITVPSLWG